MTPHFSQVGLMGTTSNPEVASTMRTLIKYFEKYSMQIIICENLSDKVPQGPQGRYLCKPDAEIAAHCDLLVVIGGDGSLLHAARCAVDSHTPVIGVNRGRRGFLTDISPDKIEAYFTPILQGLYYEERRFLLEMTLVRDHQRLLSACALNEVTLYSGDIARLLDFEVTVNGQFVYRQRSDGLITATPTGSTAYALAGGGPIIHPGLEAIVLVPMHPPMLSSRPIVLDSSSIIQLHIKPENLLHPRVSCDGQNHFDALPDDRITIQRKSQELRLLHPLNYDYYDTLRTKLHWSV